MEKQPATGPWHMVHPSEAMSWLSSLAVPWWVAGGWALDLFIGAQTRPHGDLDVGVLRRDVLEVLAALRSWELFEAKRGVLTRLRAGDQPGADVNSIWCRPLGSSHWALELMLDESDRGCWVFRRDPRIQRPLANLIRRSPDRIPYISPEIQLLYKARVVRPQDQADFDLVAPQLEANARAWLRDALCMTEPDHEWISKLDPGRQLA